jgi:hypothetical protein
VVVAIGMISNVDSVPELGAEASKTKDVFFSAFG